MMKRGWIILSMVTVFCLLSGVTATAETGKGSELPSWVTTREHSSYPPSLYLIGIGSNIEPEKACEDARAEVAAQISVNIRSTIKTKDLSVSLGDNSFTRSELERKTKARANICIEGLETVKTCEAEGIFYCMTVLNKKSFARTLAKELEAAGREVNKLVKKAGEVLIEGKAARAITLFMEADQIARKAAPTKFLCDLFSSNPGSCRTIDGYQDEIRIILSRIRIRKIPGVYSSSIGSRLQEPLKAFVYYETASQKELPLTDVLVKFSYGPGDLAGSVITNADGTVSFTPVARRGEIGGTDSVVIMAHVALPAAPVALKNELDASTEFIVLLRGAPKSISVNARNDSGLNCPKLGGLVRKTLRELGYNISDSGSPWVLDAECRTDNTRKIDNFTGSSFVMRVYTEFTLRNKTTSESYGNFRIHSVGIGDSEEEAKRSAIEKLEIPCQDLADLLVEAANSE